MDPRVEQVLKMPLYQRVLLLFVVIALIIVSYVYFQYLPARDELTLLQQQNAQILVKLQENRRIANNLPRFKAEYEKMKEQLELALNELPNKSEIPSLLTSIAGLARDNGLQVIEFKPMSEVSQDFYAKVPVSLKLSGNYHEMALFCEAVSKLARIVNINDLEMGKPEVVDGLTVLSISSTVMTYRFLDKQPATSSNKGMKK